MKSIWMEKKLVLFGHLVSMKEVIDQKSDPKACGDISSTSLQSLDANIAVNLEKEVMLMKNVCRKLQNEFVEETEAIESLTKLDETLRLKVYNFCINLPRKTLSTPFSMSI